MRPMRSLATWNRDSGDSVSKALGRSSEPVAKSSPPRTPRRPTASASPGQNARVTGRSSARSRSSARRSKRATRVGRAWSIASPSPTARRACASGPRLSRIQPSTSGWASCQMLTFGFSARPTPSETAMVFCSRISCGCCSISNCSATVSSWPSSRPIEISLSGRSRIGSPIARQACWKAAWSWCAGTKPAVKNTAATRA